jgi:hypothetical protein
VNCFREGASRRGGRSEVVFKIVIWSLGIFASFVARQKKALAAAIAPMAVEILFVFSLKTKRLQRTAGLASQKQNNLVKQNKKQ